MQITSKIYQFPLITSNLGEAATTLPWALLGLQTAGVGEKGGPGCSVYPDAYFCVPKAMDEVSVKRGGCEVLGKGGLMGLRDGEAESDRVDVPENY